MTLIAHSRDAVADFVNHLESALGPGSEIGLGTPGDSLPDAPPPTGFTVSAYARLAAPANEDPLKVVQDAARQVGAEVERNDLLDLLIVTVDH